MNENKWHNRIMHLTSFSLGVILTVLTISKGLFNLMLYVIIGSIGILLFSFVYNYIRGIDYMEENHKDYKGEDLFSEDEWDNERGGPKAYEKKEEEENGGIYN
jgi:hypothetical protein